jgi:hypothetical protein
VVSYIMFALHSPKGKSMDYDKRQTMRQRAIRMERTELQKKKPPRFVPPANYHQASDSHYELAERRFRLPPIDGFKSHSRHVHNMRATCAYANQDEFSYR